MRGLVSWAAAAVVAFAAPAMAQMAPANVRGQVVSLGSDVLVVQSRAGDPVTVKLAPTWSVVVMKPIDMTAIQTGSFIGTTEVDRPDGSGQSLEVHIFPPGVKMGEGHYPWDLKPNTMMTNGTVGMVVAGQSGRELDVSFPNGTRHIVVPPDVPVVMITFGTRDLLKPGVPVFIAGLKAPDGTYAANSVAIGVNGAPPPM
jgi:hypothetical protein